jgi:hypothetical protein
MDWGGGWALGGLIREGFCLLVFGGAAFALDISSS